MVLYSKLNANGTFGCKPTSTPVDVNVKLRKDDGPPMKKKSISEIDWEANLSEPHSSRYLICNKLSEPYENHLQAAHPVLSYFKNTIGGGLLFTRNGDLTV